MDYSGNERCSEGARYETRSPLRASISLHLRGRVRDSAGPGADARELAVGLVAAFVDALQAFGDDRLQFPDLVLLLGVFRIHQSAAVTCGTT
jgi:hypothetical protein